MPIHIFNSYRHTVLGLVYVSALGGVSAGGSATGSVAASATAEGSVTIGATATGTTHTALSGTATGSIQVGGSSTATKASIVSATGGIVVGGSSSATRVSYCTATGGIVIGGSSSASKVSHVSATGGIVIGGSSAGTKESIVTATGGIVISGEVTSSTCWPVTFPITFPIPGGCTGGGASGTATGSIVIGGSATSSISSTVSGTATGGIVIGGSATGAVASAPATATGGIVIGGSSTASVSSSTLATATGGIVIGGSSTSSISSTVSGAATGSIVIGGSSSGVVGSSFSNIVALDMDGSNDIFRTSLLLDNYDGAGTSFFEDAISISFFFRLDTVDTSATQRHFYYMDRGGNNAIGCYFTPSTGKISVKFGNNTQHTDDLSLVADTWYHLALVTNRTSYNHSYYRYHEWELFLDGTSVKSVTGNVAVCRYNGYGAKGTLDGAVTDTDTTFTIDAANGGVTWQGTSDPRIAFIGNEQVLVSANVANAATSLSVTRAQNGTTATSHADGAVISYSRDELTFGARYHTWPYLYYLDGMMDEIAVWNDTLTSSEVDTLKDGPIDLTSDSGNYASSANLQAWWRFEEDSGTSIADSSTNSHTGTLVNGATFSSSVP